MILHVQLILYHLRPRQSIRTFVLAVFLHSPTGDENNNRIEGDITCQH
nr:MAG TPA: hypothetical protein [Caudoviricetes sp.]